MIRALSTAVAAALCLPLLTAPGYAADDGAALLAKHHAYVGWQAGDGVVKTLRETGSASYDGRKYLEIEYRRIGIAHSELRVNRYGYARSSGFTGNVPWVSNGNGFTVRPVGEVARFLYDEEMVDGEHTHTLKAAVSGHAQVDGTDTTVLRLTSDVGFPIDVYVDPSSGAYKRIVIDPDGKYEETISGIGYTEIDGKRFLSSWHYEDPKYRYSWTKIEPNAPLSPDDLHPPAQTATWTFGGNPAKAELSKEHSRIYVDAVVNGVKGKFVLDTGAGVTAIVDSFARQIGAKKSGVIGVQGIGGSTVGNVYRVDTLALGGSTLHNVIVTSALDDNFKNQDDGAVGLLGFDLLGGALVSLDLDDGTLKIEDPKATPDQTGGIILHVDLSQQVMRIPMRVNGKHDVIATLDSGNAGNVLFSQDLIKRDHLIFQVDSYTLGAVQYTVGIAGVPQRVECGNLSSIALGPIQYAPAAACNSPSQDHNEILVGLDFMQHFNYVFNYPEGIVILKKRKKD